MLGFFKYIFGYKSDKTEEIEVMKKFLIVGLGNIGPEYEGTRHNTGFMIVDRLAESAGTPWESCRYGDMAIVKIKNCELMLLKPSTFMNLSGVAVRFWMNKEKIPLENLLVAVDDIALPFGIIRIRCGGADAGHNGLKNIADQLGTQAYARLRFGLGNNFPRGRQIEFVLGLFSTEEKIKLSERLDIADDAIKAFCLSGASFAMTQFNNK